MSRNYDNWERLVEAVLHKENLRQIALCHSLSSSFSSIRSDFSFPIEEDLKVFPGLRKFTFNDLRMATRNFRPSSLLGVGRLGYAFKGYIEENGTAPAKFGTELTVAIKILNHDVLEDHEELMAEVNFLGHLFHPNLVNLVGFCIEDDHRLLVYEFMPRRSLENHLI